MRQAGVYVHFPYCLAKCPYCDFTSYATTRSAIDHTAYADAVIRELDQRRPLFEARRMTSVFFGGGTPSLWEPSELGRVLAALRSAFDIGPDVEVTVECNPTSLDRDRARALCSVGVNRLSIGTQSLRKEQLAFLGRLHDPDGALSAVRDALDVAPRASTDMIFGMPEQSAEDACSQAMEIADLGVRHLSAYQLTIEPGTRFGELARRGRLPLADDGIVADAFLALDAALTTRGFRHYEISNYAKPGDECQHNLGYWRGDEYLGLGCGAYGFHRTGDSGVRYKNDVDPARYMAGASAVDEPLDREALLRERIMLGLRLAVGFDLRAAGDDLGVLAWTTAREAEATRLVDAGRLERNRDTLRMNAPAWLLADDTAARLF